MLKIVVLSNIFVQTVIHYHSKVWGNKKTTTEEINSSLVKTH